LCYSAVRVNLRLNKGLCYSSRRENFKLKGLWSVLEGITVNRDKNKVFNFFRVPILAMPVFADQPENAEKIKDKGFGNNLE